MGYKISKKRLPIPPANLPKNRRKMPFDGLEKMEVGDSVLVEDVKVARNLYSWAAHHHNWKCSMRKTQGGKYRVWRVE